MPTNDEIREMMARLTHNGPYSINWHKCMIDASEMLTDLLAEREWRPIAEAPRDGTTILGGKIGKDPFLCHWEDQKGGQWFTDMVLSFWHENVTHWRPLPAPPENNDA
jgi:hypothetical protein